MCSAGHQKVLGPKLSLQPLTQAEVGSSLVTRWKQGVTSVDSGTWEEGGFMDLLRIAEGDGVGNTGLEMLETQVWFHT